MVKVDTTRSLEAPVLTDGASPSTVDTATLWGVSGVRAPAVVLVAVSFVAVGVFEMTLCPAVVNVTVTGPTCWPGTEPATVATTFPPLVSVPLIVHFWPVGAGQSSEIFAGWRGPGLTTRRPNVNRGGGRLTAGSVGGATAGNSVAVAVTSWPTGGGAGGGAPSPG